MPPARRWTALDWAVIALAALVLIDVLVLALIAIGGAP